MMDQGHRRKCFKSVMEKPDLFMFVLGKSGAGNIASRANNYQNATQRVHFK